MYTKIKIEGPQRFPMLSALPVAFYVASLVCYSLYGATSHLFWMKEAVVATVSGVAAGVFAAMPGCIAWFRRTAPSKLNISGLPIFSMIAVVIFLIEAIVELPKCYQAINGGPQPAGSFSVVLAVIGVGFAIGAVIESRKIKQQRKSDVLIPAVSNGWQSAQG